MPVLDELFEFAIRNGGAAEAEKAKPVLIALRHALAHALIAIRNAKPYVKDMVGISSAARFVMFDFDLVEDDISHLPVDEQTRLAYGDANFEQLQ